MCFCAFVHISHLIILVFQNFPSWYFLRLHVRNTCMIQAYVSYSFSSFLRIAKVNMASSNTLIQVLLNLYETFRHRISIHEILKGSELTYSIFRVICVLEDRADVHSSCTIIKISTYNGIWILFLDSRFRMSSYKLNRGDILSVSRFSVNKTVGALISSHDLFNKSY